MKTSSKYSTSLPSLVIRPITEEDIPAVVALGEAADMGTLSAFENTTVIEYGTVHEPASEHKVKDNLSRDSFGTIIGFLRINVYADITYVNPVVIDSSWRGFGLGKLLMKLAVSHYGELRFVARGHVLPFYIGLGCQPIDWDNIAPEIVSDCDECGDFASCKPVPMRMLATMDKQEQFSL